MIALVDRLACRLAFFAFHAWEEAEGMQDFESAAFDKLMSQRTPAMMFLYSKLKVRF